VSDLGFWKGKGKKKKAGGGAWRLESGKVI